MNSPDSLFFFLLQKRRLELPPPAIICREVDPRRPSELFFSRHPSPDAKLLVFSFSCRRKPSWSFLQRFADRGIPLFPPPLFLRTEYLSLFPLLFFFSVRASFHVFRNERMPRSAKPLRFPISEGGRLASPFFRLSLEMLPPVVSPFMPRASNVPFHSFFFFPLRRCRYTGV